MSFNVSNRINNKEVTIPREFNDSVITLDYLPNGVQQDQPSLDISGLTFTNDSRKAIKDHLESKGLFTMLDYKVEFDNLVVRNGYLHNFRINDDRDNIQADFGVRDGLNLLTEQLQGLSSLLLADLYKTKNHFFIIEGTTEEKVQQAVTATLSLITSTYMLIQLTKDISDFIAEQTEVSAGSVLEKVLKGVFLAIYIGAILATIIASWKELFKLAIQPIRRTRVISFRELIEIPLNYLGYTLETNLTDLDNTYHWASRYSEKQNVSFAQQAFQNFTGINPVSADLFVPNSSDLMSSPLEVLNYIQKKYAAWVSVNEDNVVRIYNREDPFWKQNADLTLEGFPLENYRYNTDEHVVNTTIQYTTDDADQWTFEDFEGSHFLYSSQIDDVQNSTAFGSQSVDYGLARTTRKNELDFLERIYERVARAINSLAKAVGGSFVPDFQSRLGVSIISKELFSVAKVVYLDSKGRIPANHKDLLSARSDFDNYQWSNSWVLNPRNKKLIYEDVKVPFNFKKFLKVINNRFVNLEDGRKGEIRTLEWKSQRDTAVMTLAVVDDYKTGLKETYYESPR